MVAKVDGITALQKGLGPGLMYQFVMNGLRLGKTDIILIWNPEILKNCSGQLRQKVHTTSMGVYKDNFVM